MTRLSAIRKRLEAATPDMMSLTPRSYFDDTANVEFLRRAPQDLRDLLAVAEEAINFVKKTTVSDPGDVWDRLTMDITAYKKLKAAVSRLDAPEVEES